MVAFLGLFIENNIHIKTNLTQIQESLFEPYLPIRQQYRSACFWHKKTRGLKSYLDESTLALALVIPDYRPDMLDYLQREGQFSNF